MVSENKGAKELLEDVIDNGLCTGCGACISGCPYVVAHEGKIVFLDKCTTVDGECYKHCPRTHTDMNAVSRKIFGVPYSTDEIGVALDICRVRTKDKAIREKAQDGGTVTTILALALEQGIIDAVVCTKMNECKVPRGFLARSREELLQCAGGSYEASYVLEACSSVPKESGQKLGAVGLGCEVEALSKMKLFPPKNRINSDNVKLVIGLFCGWAFSPSSFQPYLKENYDVSQIVKFDIPHSPHYTFDVYTKSGKSSVSLDEIRKYINPACQYCWDMTAEFADISIGSAGSAFPGWNTIVIRTKNGASLVELANTKGIIETQALPDQRLAHLKAVALKRKKTAFKNIIEKTGNKKDFLYVGGLSKGVADKLLEDE